MCNPINADEKLHVSFNLKETFYVIRDYNTINTLSNFCFSQYHLHSFTTKRKKPAAKRGQNINHVECDEGWEGKGCLP